MYDHLKMGGSSAASASGAYVLSCPAGQQPLLAGELKLEYARYYLRLTTYYAPCSPGYIP